MRNPDQKALPSGNSRPERSLLDYFKQPSIQSELAKVMPSHLKPERMMKVLLGAISKDPKLLACDQNSMYRAAMQLSELGLEPNSPLGYAYLIPYGKDVTLVIGYRGFIDLARRSGRIKNIRARVRRENEPFSIKLGLNENIEHEYKGDSSSPVTHVYCIAEFTDGGYHFEVMTRGEVEAIRTRSKSGKQGPWVTDWEEMAKKTVVRRAAKYLPLSPEMAQAVELDESDVVDSTGMRVVVAPPLPPAPKEEPAEQAQYEASVDENGVVQDEDALKASCLAASTPEDVDRLLKEVSGLEKGARRGELGNILMMKKAELRRGGA
jgi:recombination protein RecT